MSNTLFRKGLVIGVICLLMLLSPVIPAFSIQNRDNEELISIQKGALPDLDIFGINALVKYWPEGTPYFVLECRIKNIGGNAGFITIWVEVVGELYNTDNNTYENYNTFKGNLDCKLLRGEEVFIEFARDHNYNYVHPFGKIRFRAECHTNIDESNYNNNHYTQLFYHPWYKIWIPLPIRFKNDNQNIQTTQQQTTQQTVENNIIQDDTSIEETACMGYIHGRVGNSHGLYYWEAYPFAIIDAKIKQSRCGLLGLFRMFLPFGTYNVSAHYKGIKPLIQQVTLTEDLPDRELTFDFFNSEPVDNHQTNLALKTTQQTTTQQTSTIQQTQTTRLQTIRSNFLNRLIRR